MPTRPNVLLLIADDHRHSAICDVEPVRTPTLDRLAGSGVRLVQARCQGGMIGAICAPSRACLMTGSTLFHATDGPRIINPVRPILPEWLRRAGYFAYAIGKWHNGGASLARGFDDGAELFLGGMSDHRAVPVRDFDASGEFPANGVRQGTRFSTDLFADAAVRFLREYDADRPFFCYVAFTAPHDPRTPPDGFTYDRAEIPLPPNAYDRHPFDNGDLGVRDETLAALPRDPAEIRRHLAAYYGMITHLDHGIGRILAALEQTGRARDTIVIYTADHGLAVGQHGLLGKQNMYEHSMRVPLLLTGPGLPTGATVDGLCYLHDLFPTLCELLDLPRPSTVEGLSLLPLIRGETNAVRNHAHGAYRDVQRMVRDERFKLIRYLRSPCGVGTDRTQLFDLVDDPWELRDLSADPAYADVVSRLATSLATWQRTHDDPLVATVVAHDT